MTWAKEFVELDKAIHDRESFDCGKTELNDFIKTEAAKHMKAGISRTMLLPASTPLPNGKYPICAFYTIAPSSINREDLPQELAKKLPHYPVPVFLLAQLAVHHEYHKQGLGEITLVKSLKYFVEINFHLRAYAIIVDCIDKEAEQFYLKYDFQELCKHNDKQRMYIPMKTVQKLF
ncbi:MAG: GNAT family N-acetyltransferase [Proteobacteria bacterium]|nr:GNAT family N-acetyltransferase [Pseudomonadota bacterium]